MSETPSPEGFGPQTGLVKSQSDGGSVCLSDETGQLLEEFRPYLTAIAMAELPEAMACKLGASDVVQETILKGFESFASFRGSTKEELAGWLRTILLHVLANFQKAYRSQKRDLHLEVPADSQLVNPRQESPSHAALTCEQWSGLECALSQLSEESRTAVLLRHRENLTFAEIGIRLGKSEEAARKIWARAIEQLQKKLRQD